jgi:hypothetical protein
MTNESGALSSKVYCLNRQELHKYIRASPAPSVPSSKCLHFVLLDQIPTDYQSKLSGRVMHLGGPYYVDFFYGKLLSFVSV